MKKGRAIVFGFILLALLSACTKDKSATCNTCSTVSFKSDVIPIFSANCSLPACHNSSTSANKYTDLDSAQAYASITRTGTGYVVPGNPSVSILLGQLYPNVSNHMPNNGGQLDDCSIQKISCWIQQGALNN